MEKYFFNRLVNTVSIIGIFFLISCSDEAPQPNPAPNADFDVVGNANLLEIGRPVQFINLSTNAATYQWALVDDQSDTIQKSQGAIFEFTFENTGSYDVVLKAFSKDKQLSTQSKTFQIKRRILDAFTIANISFVDQNGDSWDDDDTGPDITLIFGPQGDAEFLHTIWTDTVANMTPADLPITWVLNQPSNFELTDELFDLFILDIDEDEINPNDQAELMFGLELNPVQYDFSDINQMGSGLLQVSLGGFAIDFYFEVRLSL